MFLKMLMKIGFIKKKECRVLTLYGWIVHLSIISLLIIFFVSNIYSFFAITRKIQAEYIVIQGWLPDYAINKLYNEFKSHEYKKIFIVSGPISEGSFLLGYGSYAELGKHALIKYGFDRKKIQIISLPYEKNDKLYLTALALQEWSLKKNLNLRSINIFSIGCIARRNKYFFEKVFGDKTKIGVISVEPSNYDIKKWYAYSEGIKDIFKQIFLYIYAIMFI